MPRTADQGLEERILKAAQRLWRARGEKGLTLRAVAREARTTTTSVYKRFPSREKLSLALGERIREQVTALITSASSIPQVYRRYLDFAESHPHEYKLFWGPSWPNLVGPGSNRPVREWLLPKLAKKFGGDPEDYDMVYNALLLLTHGACSLMTASRNRRANDQVKKDCLALCDRLIENIKGFRARKR